MFFGCVATSDLYLFQEIVLLNSCSLFSKNLILSFIDKLTTGTYRSVLFIWNVAPLVCVDGKRSVGGLAVELAGASGVLDISEMAQLFVHDKSSSISQLFKCKSRDFEKLLKYFNGATSSVSNVLLSAGFLPIFLSYTQKIYLLFSCCYLFCNY